MCLCFYAVANLAYTAVKIFPKEYLDWGTVNKLAGMNPDFKEFLKRIKTDLTSKEIRREKYAQILEREDLVKLIKNQQVK